MALNRETGVTPHTMVASILYHLLPGFLIGVVYYLIVPAVLDAGYPALMALGLTAILVLVPVELGVLLWQGKRLNGTLSLRGVLGYQQKISCQAYLLWVPVIFIASGLIMTLMNPVNLALETWFDWLPERLRQGTALSNQFTRSVLIQTYVVHFVLMIFVAPTVEELYFRGFLLPRMPARLGIAGPFVHSFLFALYHLWSPWMLVARTLALLPLIYIVRWKRNLYLGMIAHWLINAIDFVVGIAFIVQMG